MRRRIPVTLFVAVLSLVLGWTVAWVAMWDVLPLAAQAMGVTPTPPYPVAPVIPGAGTAVQIWMAGPFCVDTWWDGRQCAEHKGDELHVGAGWKLDLPGPAWIAPQGRRADGAWLLWAVAKDNEQAPGTSFVAVIGPSLFTVPDAGNGSPTSTVTLVPPSPPFEGATATPGVTPTATPSPQGEATPTRPVTPITPTPMFPQFPTCTTQILIYRAGDPAEGGLGGKVGSVTWCGSCNSGCGLWMFGVDKATLDGWTDDANRRVRELWATVTVEAR